MDAKVKALVKNKVPCKTRETINEEAGLNSRESVNDN
jgi:hypothetical protein